MLKKEVLLHFLFYVLEYFIISTSSPIPGAMRPVFILASRLNNRELSMLFYNNKVLIDFTMHGSMLYILFIVVSCGYALILSRLSYYFIPFALLAIDKGLLMIKERNLKFIYYAALCSFFFALQYGRNNSDGTTFIWLVENRPVVEIVQ